MVTLRGRTRSPALAVGYMLSISYIKCCGSGVNRRSRSSAPIGIGGEANFADYNCKERRETIFSRVTGLWFIPLACVVAGVGLSLCTIAIDKAFDYKLVPQSISGGPDAAMEILGTVAASMVSLAALVLTITMVVVQLAMGQFSPRIVQRILEDKPSQLAIGIFVGTFAHAMLALRKCKRRMTASFRASP